MPKITFIANKQDRFEPGKTFPTSYVQRVITLEYSPLGNEVTITVLGVMQPKHARITGDNGRILKYQDKDNPAFRYEVETNPADNTIVRVSIFAMGIVEYRYTI